VQIEYQDYRENNNFRDDAAQRELESLRALKDMNQRDLDNLRKQVEQ